MMTRDLVRARERRPHRIRANIWEPRMLKSISARRAEMIGAAASPRVEGRYCQLSSAPPNLGPRGRHER